MLGFSAGAARAGSSTPLAVASLSSPVLPKSSASQAAEGRQSDPAGEGRRLPDVLPWLLVSPFVGGRLEDSPRSAPLADDERLSDVAAVLLRQSRGTFEPRLFSLRTSGGDKEASDLRTLLGNGESWHLVKFSAAAGSSSQDARIAAYGQVAYIPPDSRDVTRTLDDSRDPASLGVKGQLADFEVGAEYRSFGKRVERILSGPQGQKDQEGSEIWLARQIGLLRLRLAKSDLSDNVDQSPALPRTTKAQTAVTAELKQPAWPIFGVTYATGDSERVWFTPGARGPERQTFDSVAGSAYYDGAGWMISVSSTYALSRDSLRSEQETSSLYHSLSLSLRPTGSLTIAPSVTAGQDQYLWSATRSDMGYASLTLSYGPPASRWHAWTFAGGGKTQSSDSSVNGRSMSITGGLAYDLGKILPGRTTVSLEAGYDRYLDDILPRRSAQSVFGFLLLKIASF